MKIIKAAIDDFETVKLITHETIKEIYPHYYPKGAVEFFLKHHCDEAIMGDIAGGRCFLAVNENDTALGTVTVSEDEIDRLFVLPKYQGMGCGGALLDFAEDMISRSYDEAKLCVSLAAKSIYLKRGYKAVGYEVVLCDGGDRLCYDIMTKEVKDI